MSHVKRFFNALLDVIIPPLCHICHSFIPDYGTLHICQTCHERLPLLMSPLCPSCGIPFAGVGNDHLCSACLTHPPHFNSARSPFLYEGSIRELIHSFKYNYKTHLRSPLAHMTLEGIHVFLAEHHPQVIVPVPLHRSRLRQRGFNQAVLLGKVLSRDLSLPMLTDTLTRIRPTEPQIDLSALERRENVKGAFAVKSHLTVEGKRVLLLDDVMTTGSTMNECAKELKKAGAAVVLAVTTARTPR